MVSAASLPIFFFAFFPFVNKITLCANAHLENFADVLYYL